MASGELFTYVPPGAYEQQADIQGGCVLNFAGGFNPTANTGFVMFFNKLAADIDPGDAPAICFLVPALGSFSFVDVLNGRKFPVGLSFAISTTGDVYTASADEWWVSARGREL